MLRNKTWQYIALASDEAFVSAAVVNLGYAGLTFATAYDRQTGLEASFERLVPFATRMRVAEGLSVGETAFTGIRARMRLDNTAGRLALDLPGLRVEARFAQVEPWHATWPIGKKGGNETLKQMGFACEGTLRMGSRELRLDGHGMRDWTRGRPARQTAWLWSAGTARAGERLIAWNFRTGFDDPLQLENAIWVDGRPHHPGTAQIEPGPSWRITCAGLDLHFEPQGMRREDKNLVLVASRYQQPWGRYHGTFEGQPLTGYGVVEDHWARW
jgi:hypothetical protein